MTYNIADSLEHEWRLNPPGYEVYHQPGSLRIDPRWRWEVTGGGLIISGVAFTRRGAERVARRRLEWFIRDHEYTVARWRQRLTNPP